MLETQLYFDFKDMFRAPRLALGRRLLVMLEALIVSYLFFVLFSYLAQLVDGKSFGSIWNEFHLLPPMCYCHAHGIFADILITLAYVVAFATLYLGFAAVAKITIKEYKGDLFYSSKDGWKWALNNWFPVFFGPISIAIILGFFVLLAALFGWLAQWPVLDIIFYGFLFAVFLPTALFLAFAVLALAVGSFMSPSIVACAEEDTMGSMFGSFTLLWNQPVRLITYTAMILGLTFIGYHIFYLFILSAFKFIEMVFGHDAIMGSSFLAIQEVGQNLFNKYSFLPSYFEIPACLGGTVTACAPGGCGGCAGGAAMIAPTVTQTITGVLVGIVSFLAYLSVPAYALASLATGFATSFVVLTKHKDDQDLIKRKDADERAAAEAEEAEETESAGEDTTAEPDQADEAPEKDEPKA